MRALMPERPELRQPRRVARLVVPVARRVFRTAGKPFGGETMDANSTISGNVFGGPMGGYGFRSGSWEVEIDGQKYRFRQLSIPGSCELDEQRDRLETAVRDYLANPEAQAAGYPWLTPIA